MLTFNLISPIILMMPIKRNIIFLLLNLLLLTFVFGTPDQQSKLVQARYIFESWDDSDGLIQKTVNTIVQTPDGYLWLGNQAALSRFDGVRFKNFLALDTPVLSSSRVEAMCVARDGSLLIGTYRGGVYRRKNNKFFTLNGTDTRLSKALVYALLEHSDGTIYAGTTQGLCAIKNNSISWLPQWPGLARSSIYSLAETSDGMLWIGTFEKGMFTLKDGKLTHYLKEKGNGLKDNRVRVIRVSNDKTGAERVWIGSGTILTCYHGGNFLYFPMEVLSEANYIRALHSDSQGRIWVGLDNNGIRQFNTHTHSISKYTTAEGLSSDSVRCFWEDREGSLWVGNSGSGIDRLRPRVLSNISIEEGLAHRYLWTIFEAKDSSLWIGTNGGGLNRLQLGSGKIKNYNLHNGLSSMNVTAIHQTRDGSMWIGTSENGLNRLRDGKFKIYLPGKTGKENTILSIFEAMDSSRIWVGTENGLFYLENESFTRFSGPGAQVLANLPVRFMVKGKENSVWILADTVVGHLQAGKLKSWGENSGLKAKVMLSLLVDDEENVWIGSTSWGLIHFNSISGKFTSISQSQGLFSKVVYMVLEDSSQRFWMSSNHGVFYVNKSDLLAYVRGDLKMVRCISYSRSEGIRNPEFNGGRQPAGCITGNGKVCLPSMDGLVILDLDHLVSNKIPPPVVIETAQIDGKVVELEGEISVPPGAGELEFNYTALSFINSKRIRFQYQLEPFDRQWKEPMTRRSAFYTNIPHGNYTFRVRACNSEGVWNMTGTNLKFQLQPHFYETNWFYASCVLAAFFMILFVFSFRIRQIRYREKELGQQVKLRTRELERINTIANAINLEVGFDELLEAILKETIELEGIERAAALVFEQSTRSYRFRAFVGGNIDEIKDILLMPEEVEARYVRGGQEIYRDIYVVKDFEKRPGTEKFMHMGIPKAMLTMKMQVDDTPAGFLLFANMKEKEGFDHNSIKLISNLKDHIAAAFIKSKILMELKRKSDAANEANQSKSMFLAKMSHEIRTPMNGVIGFADLLLETRLSEEQKDFATTIKRSGDALLSLINEILDFSKVEAGELVLDPVEFDPELIVFDICDLMQFRVRNKDVEILCNVADSVPAYVKGDAGRFRQVLVNLMGNAAKFTESGEIELTLSARQEADVVIFHTSVRDTGIGIPPRKLKAIFDVFNQADASTTRKYGGTGLGLSISRQIAHHMNGDIRVESHEGVGSVFHFYAHMQPSNKKFREFNPPDILKDKRILVVDDNKTNLAILTHMLTSFGMNVSALWNSTEAIAAINGVAESGEPFDICILDIQMPEISGYHLAQEIRKLAEPLCQLPLLAYSASTLRQAGEFVQYGFNGFLAKPTSKQKLERMLVQLLDQDNQYHGDEPIMTVHSLDTDVLRRITILLAEDNRINQKLIRAVLTKAGYRLEIAVNGKEAVDKFTANPDKFSIILMDIQMPVMDGKEATRIIRKRGFKEIPIIAITADTMKGDREKFIDCGMNDFISKPIKQEIVYETVRKWSSSS